MIKQNLIIEFLKDLTDSQKVTLMFYCLGIKSGKIAEIRGITKQAVSLHMIEIERKKEHEEIIKAIQEAIIHKGLFF